MDALAFNRDLSLTPDVVAQIQQTVGSRADGAWGPKTVAKIAAWQKTVGLDGSGRVDGPTLAKLEACWADDDKPDAPAQDDVDDGDADFDPVADAGAPVLGDDDVTLDALLAGHVGALAAVQNDLFAFGFEPGLPDGRAGAKTRTALLAFQRAALQPTRVIGDMRTNVDITFTGGLTAQWDAATLHELRRWKHKGYRWVETGADYVERRVRVASYGRVRRSSVHLVDVPGTQATSRRLHRLAAAALLRLRAAAKADADLDLLVQSGWRQHRWTSREHYETTLREKYGSVLKGRRFLAFDSPHETGLAVDFGSEGLAPTSATIPAQRQTKAWQWLVANAWRFGWHPYMAEPWHWEFPISARAWAGGESDWL